MNSAISMTRDEAIRAIRAKLLELIDDDHSMCQVAAEKGIYCQGFRRLSDDDLRQRYSWLLRRKPDMGREELEDLANRWQLARQIVGQVPIACDVQTMEHDSCDGWSTFDDATIERFHRELVGVEIAIRI